MCRSFSGPIGSAASSSLSGVSVEPFALATEEGFTAVDPSSVTVAIDAPATVPSGGSFTVRATVSNPTAVRFFGFAATLSLPPGFSLGAGTATRSIGTVQAGKSAIVSWLVDAPQSAGDRTFDVDLEFSGYGETFGTSDADSIDFAGSLDGTDGIGIHHGSTKTFFLNNDAGPGIADLAFRFGGSTMIPLAGDWNGDGTDTIGLYLASTGTFFLRNSNSKGIADVTFRFGPPDRLPIVGDWDGDGTDTVGIYDSATGSFFLRDANSSGPASAAFRFGPSGMLPVVGDWNGDGTDTIGIYAGGNRSFFLRDQNARGVSDYTFKFGTAGSLPFSGDWDGDGVDTIGVYDTVTREFSLADENAHGAGGSTFRFGGGGVRPIAGDWDDA